MRVVGHSSIPRQPLDPVEAYRRARALDSMLAGAPVTRPRGITRGSHAVLNAEQEARARLAARRVDAAHRPFPRG